MICPILRLSESNEDRRMTDKKYSVGGVASKGRFAFQNGLAEISAN